MAAPPITPTRAARHQQQGRPQGKERKQTPPSRSRLRKVLRWTLWLAVPAVAVAAGGGEAGDPRHRCGGGRGMKVHPVGVLSGYGAGSIVPGAKP